VFDRAAVVWSAEARAMIERAEAHNAEMRAALRKYYNRPDRSPLTQCLMLSPRFPARFDAIDFDEKLGGLPCNATRFGMAPIQRRR
jgi:hypothetical protein